MELALGKQRIGDQVFNRLPPASAGAGTPAFDLRLIGHLGTWTVATRSDAARYPITVGNVEALEVRGRAVSASWFYIVGSVGVAVSFVEPGRPRLTRDCGWRPGNGHTRIRLAK